MPVFVRLFVRRAQFDPGSPGVGRLDQRLDLYAGRHVPVMLVLVDPPLDVAGVDAWGLALRGLVQRCRGKVVAYQVGDRLDGPGRPAPRDYAYLVKFVAVQVRSVDSAALVVEGSLPFPGAEEWQEQLYREDVAAYLNAIALSAPPGGEGRAGVEAALGALDRLAAANHAEPLLGVTGVQLSGRSAAGGRAVDRVAPLAPGRTQQLHDLRGHRGSGGRGADSRGHDQGHHRR